MKNTLNALKEKITPALIEKLSKPHAVKDNTGKIYIIPALWDKNRERCSFDNSKTGIASFNLLAGDMSAAYDGYFPRVLNDILPPVCGTCPGNCPGCYAKKITRNIIPAIKLTLNTIEAILDPVRFIALIENELFTGNIYTDPRIVRIHDSGEFFALEYFTAVIDMINRHPGVTFGSYTKAENIVNAYGVNMLPDNLTLSCSPWAGHCNAIGDLPQFIYDNHTDPEIAALPHCPAVDKNGKRTGVKCINCLHCYTAKRGARWAVYAH